MLIPVPVEVTSMLKMVKGYNQQIKLNGSPLLEMLLPHFEEVFDEIEIETVVVTTPYKNTDLNTNTSNTNNMRTNSTKLIYCIQGIVTVSEAVNTLSQGLGLGLENGEGPGDSGAVVVEWGSSPTGNTHTHALTHTLTLDSICLSHSLSHILTNAHSLSHS